MSVAATDTWLFTEVNELAVDTPWAHGVMAGYAAWGIVAFGVLLALAWWRARRAADPRAAVALVVAVVVAVLLAVALNQLLGHLADRPRPYAVLPQAEVLLPRSTDVSFPSDHSVAVGAVAAGLWLRDRLLAVLATLGALAMAFARVYAGVHYPGDVLAGLAVGAVVALALAPLLARVLVPLVGLLAGSALLRPLVLPRVRSAAGSARAVKPAGS